LAAAVAETNAPASTNTPASPQPAPPVSGALSSDVEALIQILQTKYINPAQVADVEMNKAAVQGIVAALKPGAELVSTNVPPASTNKPPAVRSESVASLIGYVRLDKLDAATLKELDSALNKLDSEKIDSLVLDLRFTKGGTYPDATELVSKFLLKDKKLFATQSPQPANVASYATTQTSAYIDWKIAVLINGETEGASEAAAGALREQARAIIVGTTSAGKAVVWSEETLPSGTKVRIATGKVVLASGAELFPKGVTPDIPVESTLEGERKLVFELSRGKQMREFVEQPESEKRLNEAALVKMLGKGATNQPPESADEPEKKDDKEKEKKKTPPPIDAALQRAVDILKGIRILHLD
jgi:C-terminal processing protease CtpA/Prc